MNDDRFRQLMQEFQEDVTRSQAAARAEAIERAAKEARAELRDRFAMAALTGFLAAGDSAPPRREERAKAVWEEADAMLKARGNE